MNINLREMLIYYLIHQQNQINSVQFISNKIQVTKCHNRILICKINIKCELLKQKQTVDQQQPETNRKYQKPL